MSDYPTQEDMEVAKVLRAGYFAGHWQSRPEDHPLHWKKLTEDELERTYGSMAVLSWWSHVAKGLRLLGQTSLVTAAPSEQFGGLKPMFGALKTDPSKIADITRQMGVGK